MDTSVLQPPAVTVFPTPTLPQTRQTVPKAIPKVSLFLWKNLHCEASDNLQNTFLSSLLTRVILNHSSLAEAMSELLSSKLQTVDLPANLLYPVLLESLRKPHILEALCHDLKAVRERDPASSNYLNAFLFFKGFHALQTHRVAHDLWTQGRTLEALFLQSQSSSVFGVDIHPAAPIGKGIMFDHATGIVIGETAVIEDNVSILHGVTLGGTGKQNHDRHPKVRSGVLIGAGAKILGNIEIGQNAKVGAGSVVLRAVRPCTSVAGSPAKEIGNCKEKIPALEMIQEFDPGI
jgi:serine O-acetyltransferase